MFLAASLARLALYALHQPAHVTVGEEPRMKPSAAKNRNRDLATDETRN